MVLWSLLMLTTSGCGGCNSSSDSDEQAEQTEETSEEKKENEPLEIEPLYTLINSEPIEVIDEENPRKPAQKPLLMKPGHWTAVVQRMKANYDDFVGAADAPPDRQQ